MNIAIKVSIGGLVAAFASIAFVLDAARATVVASDNASNAAYTDGWQAGDNGGTGFGPWAFSFSGSGSGLLYSPQFIDRMPLAGNSLGAPSFALTTGDQRSAFETSEVRRPLLVPLAVGQKLSANINGSALDPQSPSYTIGNTFDLLASNGSERFSLFTNNDYHSNRWTVTGDLDTGIAAGGSFHIEFTLTSTNTYNLVLSPVVGGAALFTQTGATLAGTTGASITTIRISDYGTGSSAEGSKEYFFDDLMITSPSIAGDFNQDGSVDAADYVVWRKTDGTPAGYDTWRSHFGEPSGNGSGASLNTNVPEPATLVMLMLAAVGSCFQRRRSE